MFDEMNKSGAWSPLQNKTKKYNMLSARSTVCEKTNSPEKYMVSSMGMTERMWDKRYQPFS